jgi:hypothetical protein
MTRTGRPRLTEWLDVATDMFIAKGSGDEDGRRSEDQTL